MIIIQFRIYLCHFHCSRWQNHLLNFTFREKGHLVLAKTTFSSLFRNKLLIPQANCNGHVPFDMFHHICPQSDTLGFWGEKYLSEQHWQMRHIRLHGCIVLYESVLMCLIIITFHISYIIYGKNAMANIPLVRRVFSFSANIHAVALLMNTHKYQIKYQHFFV